ncbi:MAG: type I-F CRISPR-associated helicase Cas3 [Sorangiineae bacterium NIC37A_2]|nr:MAG: type I-F CRISPR-associated helicase Cas3 [Sorangiineae bacterium NIC37A_2]
MNVLIVSQCEKRALSETRRILDQFAERRGDRTWQTSITQAGLDTLRKLLKKTARKNTSVACHWIRGHDYSELAWIVGDASRFNDQGTVPTNSTGTDVLRSKDENSWQSLEDIQLLAMLGSLFHDFGKASAAFQQKLTSKVPIADAYRHEWVSLRLFEAFVGKDSDRDWLNRLAQGDALLGAEALLRLKADNAKPAPMGPFSDRNLGPLAQAIGWLIVSHHRLPVSRDPNKNNVGTLKSLLFPLLPDWNGARSDSEPKDRAACWDFPYGTPFDSRDWSRRAAACAQKMLERPGFIERASSFLDDSYVMHISRLALMLADHHYSSCDSEPRYGDTGYPLFANTDRKTNQLKQRLDEHLAGVASHARRVTRALPRIERDLPRIARCKAFQKRTADERFRWQDKAFDLASSLRERAADHGFFGVNMASTGCGKTLANGRILYGLSDARRGARFTVALGLRTLTLQTGEAYRERLGLGDDDLAVLVGGAAVKELFALSKENSPSPDGSKSYGSESAEELLAEGFHVHFEGNLEDGPLKRWLGTNSGANKLLQAPVLVCTIDHIMPATESLRGGHQIAPILRLLSSDLVLDEPDDFDVADLPALSRLVHWAGLLGSRVVLSSATLPPGLIEALFDAYRTGRETFQKNRGEVGRAIAIPCAWFDEFRVDHSIHQNADTFRSRHAEFVEKRLAQLRKEPERRKVELIAPNLRQSSNKGGNPSREDVCAALGSVLPEHLVRLHSLHHTTDPVTEKNVSFGLVRLANIEPIILLARGLFSSQMPEGYTLHLCVYHAKHPLLMRSATENLLDVTLKRHVELEVFSLQHIQQALAVTDATHHLFVVLASPIAEVGRDHDYDWAIVEPSSMRSIIQLAGRIRRHRPGPCSTPNIMVLAENIKAVSSSPGEPAFHRPGFEGEVLLKSHDLRTVLLPEQWSPLDAAPRIQERLALAPSENLVDLEHAAIRKKLLGERAGANRFHAAQWWTTRAPLSGMLQKAHPFRKSEGEESEYGLLPVDEDAEDIRLFERVEGRWRPRPDDRLLHRVSLPASSSVRSWGPSDYRDELLKLSERTDMAPRACAERYGYLALKPHDHGWEYHPALGFKKCK